VQREGEGLDYAMRASLRCRARKWNLYCEEFPPRRGEKVLDVGASCFDDNPGANYFLKRYPFPEQVTAVGIQDLSRLGIRYPGVTFVQADGRDMPFADREFDVVHSNAVVEHVGPRREQERFVRELVRVAVAGFVTSPNRWFPFETHAKVPLLHWLPPRAYRHALAIVRQRPLRERNVWLLSARQFRHLFPKSLELHTERQRIAGFTATLTFIF
jgi:hypothetical protein